MLKKYGLLCLFFYSIYLLSAQENDVETQDLFWTRYKLKFKINEKWTPYFDVEERFYMFPFRQHHFLPSLGVNYKLSDNLSFTAAVLYFELTLPQDPSADFSFTSRELWPLAAINFKHKIDSKFTVLSRLKSEIRYKQRESDAFTFRNVRLRMRLGLTYNLTPKLKAKVLEEVLINFRNEEITTVFDQNRLSAGFNYKINDQFQFEAGYMNWFQQRSNTNNFYNRNIVYFSLLHNLKFY
jgi:hypothetical protein